MNEKEVEVAIEVLKERQRVQGNHLKDVDECCGKLKGSTSAEFLHLWEHFSKLEEDMNNNCHDVEVEVAALEEKVKSNEKMVDSINSNLTKIRYLIYAAILTSLATLIFK